MAEKPQEEPTEKATPKREKESRDKGQIARSKELATMGVTLASAFGFLFFGSSMLQGITDVLTQGLSPTQEVIFDQTRLLDPLKAGALHIAYSYGATAARCCDSSNDSASGTGWMVVQFEVAGFQG